MELAKPYRVCTVSYERFVGDFTPGAGEDEVDREALLGALKAYLQARELKADWAAVGKTPTETLVNSLAMVSPYGSEEKQALLEAADLKTRAEMLVALAEMEHQGRQPRSGLDTAVGDGTRWQDRSTRHTAWRRSADAGDGRSDAPDRARAAPCWCARARDGAHLRCRPPGARSAAPPAWPSRSATAFPS